ncbi:MAG: zinc-binding dehydrogenase [Thermoplasmatota archaeon]
MKAVVVEKHGGPEVNQLKEIPDPTPGPTDVVIDVKASGVNPNEYWAREGKVRGFDLPLILGSDAAGVVSQVGSAVTHIQEGDEVAVYCGVGCRHCFRCINGEEHLCENTFRIWGFDAGPMWGAHAEKVCMPAYNAVPKPTNTSFEEAASMPLTLVTAWHMLVANARVQPNDTVLIRGSSGGVGFFATQIAKMRGAKVIGVVSSEEKAKLSEKFGADETIIRPHTTPETHKQVTKDFLADMKDRTRGRGVDVVFDSIGGETLMESIKLMRAGGKLVTCGATAGYKTDLELAYIFIQNKTIMGSTLGTKAELIQALRAVEAGHIKSLVTETLPLEKAGEAQQLLQERKATGKVVLTR